jgi:putative Mn2+ efflux pump MntP
LPFLTLLLTGLAEGASNFAAAVTLGISGPPLRTKVRIVVVFGLFETLMPVVGILLGQNIADRVSYASVIGGCLLIAVGAWEIIEDFVLKERERERHPGAVRTLVLAVILSIDNLVIGFALGALDVPIITSALILGAISIIMMIVGLEIGRRVGERFGERAERSGGAALIVIGILVATGVM